MRKLLYCSLGDTNQFKWAERNGNVWEDHSLKCVELGAPELEEAYQGFKMVLAEMFRFEGLTDAITHRIELESISISYDDAWIDREMQIRCKYFIPVLVSQAKIVTPKIPEHIGEGYFEAGKFKLLLDTLQDECCRYIDGIRAQQVLCFNESATDAETESAKAE